MAKRNNKIVATIEARMSSSRLPGKVLMKADGKPFLWHLVQRLKSVPSIQEIAIATTINPADEPLVEFAKENNIKAYRGDEDDVMARVIKTAQAVEADIIVEITGDCPIIDPWIIEHTIRIFLANKCDYASNAHVRSYPDGMDVQVFRLSTLMKSYDLASEMLEREHVTLHIRRHPKMFKHLHLIAAHDVYWPELGLTLDEQSDYLLLKRIIEHFGEDNRLFSCKEVIDLLRANPDWLKINEHVRRKGDT